MTRKLCHFSIGSLYKESKLELFDEVQSLLKEGAQVDQQDSKGNSLLMIATKKWP